MATNIPATPTTHPSDSSLEGLPTDPRRVRAFATFFKSYMSIWTIVIAALPAPVTALNLIPTYEAHRYLLSVYTPLFCFLLLGYIFFSRHILGRRWFYYRRQYAPPGLSLLMRARIFWNNRVFGLITAAPLLLLVVSFLSAIGYIHTLEDSVLIARAERSISSIMRGLPTAVARGTSPEEEGMALVRNYSHMYDRSLGLTGGSSLRDMTISILSKVPLEKSATWERLQKELSFEEIPLSPTLKWRYMLIFLTAEAAFILMAIKEYLQDVLQMNDIELIRPPVAEKSA